MAENTKDMAEEKEISKEELGELLKIRREKLEKLQSEGKDPFKIVKYPVDTHSMDIKNDYEGYEGKEVVIGGQGKFLQRTGQRRQYSVLCKP